MPKKKPSADQTKDKSKETDKLVELETNLRRALADYDNLKKQTEKEKAEFARFANGVIIEQLAGIWEGLDIVNQQLKTLMQSHGFEEIPIRVGDKFDPNIMEAVMSDGGGEKVVEVLGKGFMLNKKVVRAARVKVGEVKLEVKN
ncbi:nucleotide exchange factor GrpE [Patescibacteria group bacterium]|nr:nucleotide exchange factor GrpE [Patescibacteria group bacterium]